MQKCLPVLPADRSPTDQARQQLDAVVAALVAADDRPVEDRAQAVVDLQWLALQLYGEWVRALARAQGGRPPGATAHGPRTTVPLRNLAVLVGWQPSDGRIRERVAEGRTLIAQDRGDTR